MHNIKHGFFFICLSTVKADIQQHQSQLAQLCEQNERMLGELAMKKQTLADAEVRAKCAHITKLSLLEQKDKLLKERSNLKAKIVSKLINYCYFYFASLLSRDG